MALRIGRLSEAEKSLGAVDVARFEIGRAHIQKTGGIQKVLLGEIDKPFHLTAGGAIWLTGEADAVHLHVQLSAAEMLPAQRAGAGFYSVLLFLHLFDNFERIATDRIFFRGSGFEEASM